MFALAGNAGATPAQDIYQHPGNFYDITSGNDGTCSPSYLCTAGTGYDGPTGIGTPNGITGLRSLARPGHHRLDRRPTGDQAISRSATQSLIE
jgi:hypothetical protein